MLRSSFSNQTKLSSSWVDSPLYQHSSSLKWRHFVALDPVLNSGPVFFSCVNAATFHTIISCCMTSLLSSQLVWRLRRDAALLWSLWRHTGCSAPVWPCCCVVWLLCDLDWLFGAGSSLWWWSSTLLKENVKCFHKCYWFSLMLHMIKICSKCSLYLPIVCMLFLSWSEGCFLLKIRVQFLLIFFPPCPSGC